MKRYIEAIMHGLQFARLHGYVYIECKSGSLEAVNLVLLGEISFHHYGEVNDKIIYSYIRHCFKIDGCYFFLFT